jgi:hypothetical protein
MATMYLSYIKKAERTTWMNCLKMAQVCTYQLIRGEVGKDILSFCGAVVEKETT